MSCRYNEHYDDYGDRNTVIEVISDNAHFFIPRDMTSSSELDEICFRDMSKVEKTYMYAGSWTAAKAVMAKTYALSQDDEYIESILKREAL